MINSTHHQTSSAAESPAIVLKPKRYIHRKPVSMLCVGLVSFPSWDGYTTPKSVHTPASLIEPTSLVTDVPRAVRYENRCY